MAESFINETSIMSVTACVMVITYGVNAISDITEKYNPKHIGLILSMLVSLLNAVVVENATYLTWVLIPFNACMLYCMAFGLNASLSDSRTDVHGALPDEQDIPSTMESGGVLPALARILRAKSW
jgi:hypothetical protein